MRRQMQSQKVLLFAVIICGLLILAYETGMLNLEVVPSLIARDDGQHLILKKDGKIRHVYPKSIIELSNGVLCRFGQVVAGKIVVESVTGEILAVRPDEVSIVIRSLQPNVLLTSYIAGLIGFGMALQSTKKFESSGCGGPVYSYDPGKALPYGIAAGILGGAAVYGFQKAGTYNIASGDWELVIE